jgi:hypothetical protein
LLDKARQKILNHIKCDTWEDLLVLSRTIIGQ